MDGWKAYCIFRVLKLTHGWEQAMNRSVLVVVDDDPAITEGLAAGLYGETRTIVTCHSVEAAELMVEEMHPAAVISDIQLSGRFDFDGLRLLQYAAVHSPETVVVLMSGALADGLGAEAERQGAVAFLQKPFSLDDLEHLLESRLPEASPNGWRSREDVDVIRIPMLDDIISGDTLFARFQPIVNLGDHGQSAHGYESLIRLLTDSPLANPVALFRYATRSQKLFELDLACIDRGMRFGQVLAAQGYLFVNVHPQSFEQWDVLERTILSSQERYGLSPSGIVLEITEQIGFNATAETFAGFERLRKLGFRFALDDVGAGFSHLEYVDRIKPSYLKISQQLGSGFETDPTRVKIVRNVVSLAKELDCKVILEGVETVGTDAAAADMGIEFAQGFLYSRAVDASTLAMTQPHASGAQN